MSPYCAWASGTLVDYPRWLKDAMRAPSIVEQVELDDAVDELGIGWRIRYAVSLQFQRGSAWLERRAEGRWERVELPEVRFAYGEVLNLGGEATDLGDEIETEAAGDGSEADAPAEEN